MALADSWRAPAVAGNDYVLLAPASGHESCLRFVGASEQPEYRPLKCYGWNAIEIIVTDVDALAKRLSDSPFRIIGQPANLSFSDDIRAMQVIGPSHEVLYLTQVKAAVPGFDLPMATAFVGHPFIMILGGRSLTAIKSFYQQQFTVTALPDADVRITVLSDAFNKPEDTLYPLSVIPLGGQCYIEVDQMPPEAMGRHCLPGHLPPGIAMVSFEIKNIEKINQAIAEKLICCRDMPYAGRQSATLIGPANELIELLVSPVE